MKSNTVSTVLRLGGVAHLLFSLAVLIGFPSFIHAQATTTPPPIRQFEFSLYPIGNGNWKGLLYQPEPGRYSEIRFRPYDRSPRFKYRGPLPLRFFREDTDPGGNRIHRPVAELTLEGNSREQLLFFIAMPHTPPAAEFRLVPMDDHPGSFPVGSIVFLNETGITLEGVFGGKPIILQRGLSAPYRLDDYYERSVLIGLAVQFEGRTRKVLQNQWSFFPNYRELIVLLPPKNAESFRIQAFRVSQHQEELQRPFPSPVP